MKDEHFESIKEHVMMLHQLAKQSVLNLQAEVDSLIDDQEQDGMLIEHMLDTLLDLAFIPEGLAEFKKLCRYYLTLNPMVTRDYIYAYRDLWDQVCDVASYEYQ